jgi:hypothetical protein
MRIQKKIKKNQSELKRRKKNQAKRSGNRLAENMGEN